MYRKTFTAMKEQTHIENLRKEAFVQIKEIFIAAQGIPRERYQRFYRSQCMYIFQNQLKEEGDYIKLCETLYELNKVKRRLIAFWYYPGRPLDYQEALLL